METINFKRSEMNRALLKVRLAIIIYKRENVINLYYISRVKHEQISKIVYKPNHRNRNSDVYKRLCSFRKKDLKYL